MRSSRYQKNDLKKIAEICRISSPYSGLWMQLTQLSAAVSKVVSDQINREVVARDRYESTGGDPSNGASEL